MPESCCISRERTLKDLKAAAAKNKTWFKKDAFNYWQKLMTFLDVLTFIIFMIVSVECCCQCRRTVTTAAFLGLGRCHMWCDTWQKRTVTEMSICLSGDMSAQALNAAHPHRSYWASLPVSQTLSSGLVQTKSDDLNVTMFCGFFSSLQECRPTSQRSWRPALIPPVALME